VIVVLGVLVLGVMAVMSSSLGGGPFADVIEHIDEAMGGGGSSIRVQSPTGNLRISWNRHDPARVEWNDEQVAPEDFEIKDGLLTVVVPRSSDGVLVHYVQPINPRAVRVDTATSAERRLGLILGPDEDGGLVVRDVAPDTPAAAADMVVGDVLLAVDGSGSVTVAALRSALLAHIPGGELLLTARRDEDTLSFALPLSALVKPDDWEASEEPDLLMRYFRLSEPDDGFFPSRNFAGPPDT